MNKLVQKLSSKQRIVIRQHRSQTQHVLLVIGEVFWLLERRIDVSNIHIPGVDGPFCVVGLKLQFCIYKIHLNRA